MNEELSSSAINNELQAIDALATWLEDSLGQSGSVSLWEDQGALFDAPETKPLAYKIFLDMGLLDAINTLGLPVYIPTYLSGDSHKFGGTFASVEAMEASNDIPVGKYVVISSNDEDNGNLYLKTETEYTFITNICGKNGVTFTPHIDLNTGYLTWSNDGNLENPPAIRIGAGNGGASNLDSITIKGSVTNYSDLPKNPEIDDMYNVVNANSTYNVKSGDKLVWNGASWDNYGHVFNFNN